GGSNYGKPYPPKGGAAELPEPNPPREKQVETLYVEVPSSEPAAVASAPVLPQPAIVPQPALIPQPAPLQPQAPVSANPTIAASPHASPVAPGWAQAYQDAQRLTAEAHVAYVQTMAQTHTAYLDTIGRSFQSLAGQAGLQPAASIPNPQAAIQIPAAPSAQSQPLPVPMALAPVAAAVPVATPLPVATPAPVALQAMEPAPTVAGSPAVQNAAPAQAVEANHSTQPFAEPGQQPQSAGGGVDLQALLLEVVSEKTGYPPEMLTMEMELEADLGIDSIKRVEILSAMNDLAPGLPEVDTAVMARLATLGEVVEYMDGQLGGRASAPAAASGEASYEAEVIAAEEPPAGIQTPDLGRYVLDAIEQPAIGMAPSGLFGDGRIVVTDEGSGVAQHLVTARR
ncbi:MAG: hypothetical protein JRG89_11410, partial [Deltaproteobacteria bacterium]|nr:hypothetical protein [Deltaproteobacteria bacterium]